MKKLLQKFKDQWAICILLILVPFLHVWIGTGDFYIADSLLKAMQTESLIQNDFKSEELQYPAQSLDPQHENFFLSQAFVNTIQGKFIGAFPVAFSVFTSLIKKAGLDWNLLPFLFSLSMVFSFYFLTSKKVINQKTAILGYGATILFALSLDFNEYSIYFMLNTLGFVWWMEYRETGKVKLIYLSLITISLSIWFRLESSPFLLSLLIAEVLTSKFKFQDIWKEYNFFIILLSLSPAILFLLWNYFDYGHVFGARFLFNFGNNGSTTIDRIQRFFSMTFVNYVDGIPKFGLFFCSSFLLLPILYYLVFKKERTDKENFLILLSLSYIILIGASAPNDGITITGRYLMLSFLPLLVLWDGWNPSHSKVWKILSVVLIVFSFLISAVTLKIFHHAAKQERSFRQFYARNDAPLWLFTDPILCGQAGLEHLSRKILCLNSKTNFDPILENIKKESSITSLVLFEMNAKEAKSFGKSSSEFFPSEKLNLKERLRENFQTMREAASYKGVLATQFTREKK
ncbi:hypothetical protein A0128_02235 [Leptospira tipperaryensis]|uniref:Glycosyltransferase RgtA/B/C/D-like domain-containing protein n=1 Tax=Leptospira tipperaryensis TaxID=2564040 RepID=A0A1D7UT42_9LEPT|nr:hypothetical protein [Leptospira tipperaryensis]AOP32792.1 hypothetical protein A0128_02235 [Leptospira tipperaryensis]